MEMAQWVTTDEERPEDAELRVIEIPSCYSSIALDLVAQSYESGARAEHCEKTKATTEIILT